MEPFWIFSATDNSVDFVGAIIFAWALWKSLQYLYLNHLNIQGRIIYIFISVVSFLHIFQTIVQLTVGGPVFFTFRTWDLINFLTAVLFIMTAERIYRKEKNYK